MGIEILSEVKEMLDIKITKSLMPKLLLIWFLVTPYTLLAQNMDSVEGDRKALLDLYSSTIGANWHNSQNWGDTVELGNWYGVETDSQGRVVRLDLRENNLLGQLPPSMGNLSSLKYINIKQNSLTGEIPVNIGNWREIEWFLFSGRYAEDPSDNPQRGQHPGKSDMSGNKFTGAFPDVWANFKNLKYVEISGSSLNPIFYESIGESSELLQIHINYNTKLTQSLPSSISKLTKLQKLYLRSNALTGELPSFADVTDLRFLHIGNGNNFSGPIPNFSRNTMLREIILDGNDLTGEWPHYWNNGEFNNLITLRATWNNLFGSLHGFENLNLKTIVVNGNNLSGKIPQSITRNKNLILIGLGWNDFIGELPPDLSMMYQLRYIRANNNNFTGKLPALHTNNKKLSRLFFEGNNFSGPVDSTIVEAVKKGRDPFFEVNISSNRFCESDIEGFIKEIEALSKVEKFSYGNQNNSDCENANSEATEPVIPKQQFPSDNAVALSIQSSLMWENTGADYYRLQVKMDNSSETVVDVEIKDNTHQLKLWAEYNRTYRWRVKAVKNNLESEWSNEWSFTMGSDPSNFPSAPVQYSPKNDVEGVALNPEFSWSDIGADYYILHVSRLNPTGMYIDVMVEDTTFIPEEIFDDGTIHDWRVRGVKNGEPGDWSNIQRFTTAETGLPSVANLVSPAHFAEDVDPETELIWEDVQADSYEIRVLNNLTSDTLFSDTSTTTVYKPSEAFPDTMDLIWQVKSIADGVEGSWGPRWEFSTGVYGYSVESPSLIAPHPGSEYENLVPIFEWNNVDADHYVISVTLEKPSNAKSLIGLQNETVVIFDETTEAQYVPQSALEPEKRYYWRVKAVKDGTEGEWSGVWEFSTPSDQQSTPTEPSEDPLRTKLAQNYPNPFNPVTQIEFTLSTAQNVSLRVYDMAGRHVSTLVEGLLQAGEHRTSFTAEHLASGIYLYRFMSETHQFTRKMTLLK